MVTAVTRFHFERPSEEDHDRTWWTGLTWVAFASVAVLTPLWIGRHTLVSLTLPHSVQNGEWLYTLTLATILVQLIGLLVDGYLRVLKWSGVFVIISLGRLLLNVCLNVWFLVGMKYGVEGLLHGQSAGIIRAYDGFAGCLCLHSRALSVQLFTCHTTASIQRTADGDRVSRHADARIKSVYSGVSCQRQVIWASTPLRRRSALR